MPDPIRDEPTWRLLELEIVETSLVDRGANDKATIESVQLAKRDDLDDVPEVPGMAPDEVGALRKFFGRIFPGLAKKEEIEKRDFSSKQRDQLGQSGAALPDGSYPIVSEQDLKNAIQAYGRAKDPAKAKAHIIDRAKHLGGTHLLPADWEGSTKTTKTEAARNDLLELLDIMDLVPNQESKEAHTMALSESVRDILKKHGFEDIIKAADEKEAASTAPAVVTPEVPAVAKAEVVLAKGPNSVEVEALAQGIHLALQAVGAPPHDIAEGGDDVSGDDKADRCIDMIKAATGLDEVTVKLFEETLGMAKRGRHSAADMGNLAKAHDLSTKIGAKCDMGKHEHAIDMQKVRADMKADFKGMLDEFKKGFTTELSAKDAKIAELQAKIDKHDAQPAPLPTGFSLRAIERDGTSNPYTPPGTVAAAAPAAVAETITAPNGQKVSKVINDPMELTDGIKKINEAGGVGGIEQLMMH